MMIPRYGMIGAFTFNGRHTSEFQCVSRSISRPLLPSARIKRVSVPTMSGVQDFDDLEYDTKTSTFRIMYIGKDFHELRSRAREIAAWLTTPNWAKLILDDEPTLFQWAKITSETDLNHFLQSGAIDCEFECQPFALSLDNTTLTLNGTIELVCEGTRHIDNRSPQGTTFTLTAQVAGPTSFQINDRIMAYTGTTSGTLVIDTIKMAVTLDGINVFPQMSGNLETFFRINPGANTYQTSAAVSPLVEFSPLWY